MYKSTALIEKMAAIGNAADPKIIADGKIMADVKIPVAREKQTDGKSLQALKSPLLMKYPRP